ncbi:MAG: OsmC family protein [Kiritimatiellae bacterium]|nr:OsmC family protein [Kiritimatiellia bacterium]
MLEQWNDGFQEEPSSPIFHHSTIPIFPGAGEDHVQAITRFPGGKKVDVELNGVTVRTDQSVKNGGEGSAAEPFTLFLASIAACAGVYALEFCQTRGLSTEGLSVVMSGERDPEKKRYMKFRIEVKTPEDFPDKYREAILRAVNLCSVKKHIVNPPEFEVALV